MSTLNVRQRLFVNYLVNDAKDDPVKAARLAGYARPETAAVKLMESPTIAAEMERRLEQAGAMSVAEVLSRLSSIASLDVMEFVDFRTETKKDGSVVERPFLDLKRIKKLRKGDLVKDLKIRPGGDVEVNFHNAVDALDRLAKYHGMFKERIEVEHLNGDPSSDRIVAILGGLAQLAGAMQPGADRGEAEPGALRDRGEQWEVEAGPPPDVDQPTLALDRPEGDRPPGDHARAEAR